MISSNVKVLNVDCAVVVLTTANQNNMIVLPRRIKMHKGSYFFAYVQILSYLCGDFCIVMTKKQERHIVEWVVGLAACGYLVWRLAIYDDYSSLFVGLRSMGLAQWFALIASVFLMPVNMFIESWRWRTLMGKELKVESREPNDLEHEGISWSEAQRQVYFSKMAGLITPWRLGEYPARGLLMVQRKRDEGQSTKDIWTKVLSMGVVGSATMTIAIIIGGLIGFSIVGSPVYLGDGYMSILLGWLIVAVLLAFIGWGIRVITLRQGHTRLSVDRRLTVGIVSQSTFQSLVRLSCWCVQLGLVLYAFGGMNALMDGMGFESILILVRTGALTAIYYLFVTITPNVPIAEVGVRGAWAIAVFGTAQGALAGVVLWVINTLLPCAVWLFFRKKQ